jgi:hypothetical protein
MSAYWKQFNRTYTIGRVGGNTGPPVISNPSTYNVQEGSSLNITLVADKAVTWTKVGGADSSQFSLVGSVITLGPKDFEVPVDADANNTYVVTVRATDAQANIVDKTITVTVTDVLEALRGYGVGTFMPDFEPEAITQPTTLSGAITALQTEYPGITSGDVLDWTRDGYSSIATLFLDAYTAGKGVTLPGGTYNVPTYIQYRPRFIMAYNGQAIFNETRTRSTTGTPKYGFSSGPNSTNDDNRVWLIADIDDFTGYWCKFSGYGLLMGNATRKSLPLGDSDGFCLHGILTSGSSSISGIADTTGVTVGAVLKHASIPPGTTVVSFSGGSIVMSAAATSTVSQAFVKLSRNTGITVSGSAIITSVTSTVGLTTGVEIQGDGIPVGTRILSIDSSTQLTMTKNATASASDVRLYIVGAYKREPYYNSSNKLLKMLDQRGTAAGWPTRRVGKITLAGGTGTVSVLTGTRQREGTPYSTAANTAYYYPAFDSAWDTDATGINHPSWLDQLETESIIVSATISGTPTAVATDLVSKINAQTATTGTRAQLGRNAGEVYIIRDDGPGDYLQFNITTTGTLTQTNETCGPKTHFRNCAFEDVDMVVGCQLDVLSPGMVQFTRCTSTGTWGWYCAMAVRWSYGGLLASNNLAQDCVGTRQQPSSNVNAVNTQFYLGANEPVHCRYQTVQGTLVRIENNSGLNLESVNATDESNSAVYIDCRHPGRNSIFHVLYNYGYRILSMAGAEDSNWCYGKTLGGGVLINNNKVDQAGGPWVSQGLDGCECSMILLKEGPHPVGETVVEASQNVLINAPEGSPIVKIDEQLGITRIWGNYVRNWRNLMGGVTNQDPSHAGAIRVTNKIYKIEIYKNRFENIDMANSYYGISMHILIGNRALCASWRIDNNEWESNGTTYPAFTGDKNMIRVSWNNSPTSPVSGADANNALIRTGFNKMKHNGTAVGNALLFKDGTAGIKRGTVTAGSPIITSISPSGTSGLTGRQFECVGFSGLVTVLSEDSSTQITVGDNSTVTSTNSQINFIASSAPSNFTGTGTMSSDPWVDPTII